MYWYKNLPSYQTADNYQRRSSPSRILRRTFIEFLILMFLLGVAYFFFSGINYVDIRDQCFIRVKYDVLQGDRDSIFEALKQIKQEDYVFYKSLCQHVDRIYEKRCVLGEKNSSKLKYLTTKGCYIKGSRAILLTPLNQNEYDKVHKRIDAIKLYGQMAIDYEREHPEETDPHTE